MVIYPIQTIKSDEFFFHFPVRGAEFEAELQNRVKKFKRRAAPKGERKTLSTRFGWQEKERKRERKKFSFSISNA